jgi:hypothetical protein
MQPNFIRPTFIRRNRCLNRKTRLPEESTPLPKMERRIGL